MPPPGDVCHQVNTTSVTTSMRRFGGGGPRDAWKADVAIEKAPACRPGLHQAEAGKPTRY